MECGLTITNASCTAAASIENIQSLDESEADGIVTKTCTQLPFSNILAEYDLLYYHDGFGAVNRVGLVNPGFDYYKKIGTTKPYTISIAGTIDELSVMMTDSASRADQYEVNVSCRNVPRYFNAGLQDLLTLDVDKVNKPVGLKLSPYYDSVALHNVAKTINALKDRMELLCYVVCCNTIPNSALGVYEGSLSGGYLKPVALWNVREMRKLLNPDIRVIASGGVSSIADIREYQMAGAAGVQIGTALIQHGADIFRRLKGNMHSL
jgi:dihydroorotate dehydrogenase (fumarate)